MTMVLTATLLGFGSIASAASDYSRNAEKGPAGLQTRSCKASVEERVACRNEGRNRMSEIGPDARNRFNRSSEGRGNHGRMNGLEERLGLSKRQIAQVKELREKQFSLVVTERKELAVLQRELEKKSFSITPDRKKIDELSDKIGKKNAALAQLKSNHLAELVSILTPAQRTKLQTMRDARPLRQHGGRF